ncbi:hypothetical protein BDN70DRAFT_887191 [Pholiota conissans]|uniref:Secreted protein n=1 Tax=Pholiota conissans TaxID=109636 RepID=A0A9P6CMY4_9AGAR|nr:hypothetical protein BDN70DRAFT_887191 [Pholiota conissans]
MPTLVLFLSSARSLLFILSSLARSSMILDARVPRHRRHPSHAGRVRVMHICGCGCLGWDERLTPYAALSVGVSPSPPTPESMPPLYLRLAIPFRPVVPSLPLLSSSSPRPCIVAGLTFVRLC